MRYFTIIIPLLFLVSCAKQPYPYMAEEIDSVEEIDSLEKIDSTEVIDTSWTTWNKVMFGFAVAGQAADAHSTMDALDRGCVEANPLLGENPSDGTLVLVKVAGMGAAYLITEYLAPEESRQIFRNVVYGSFGAIGLALGIHNYSIDCN